MSRRVLIIDDQEDFRTLLAAALGRFGDFEVVGDAPDATIGMELANDLRPDVVMLDLTMPERDGLELLPLLRSAVPDAHVVVVSAWPETEAGAAARELGANAYLEKGQPLQELVADLTRQLAGT